MDVAEPAEMPMREARDHLADVVNRAAYTKEPVFLTRRGRRIAAVVDAATFERLVELAEDALDAEAADAARAEMDDGAAPVPWEQVKADLGLA
jgi:prevent-host-death family protein